MESGYADDRLTRPHNRCRRFPATLRVDTCSRCARRFAASRRRSHRHRYHGVLAPNARLRQRVITLGRDAAEVPTDTANLSDITVVEPIDAILRRLNLAVRPAAPRPSTRAAPAGPRHVLDRWIDSVPDFLSYGRQGLFAHDNTHHALFMAYSAVDCLVDGRFDEDRWNEYREIFATHVVED
jgi:hypothetical protein